MDLYGRKFENGFMGFDLEVFRLPDSQDVWFIGKDVADVMVIQMLVQLYLRRFGALVSL